MAKIIYLSSSFFPSKAANSVHVIKMCDAFSRAGHETTLYGYIKNTTQDDIKHDYGVTSDFKIKKIKLFDLPIYRGNYLLSKIYTKMKFFFQKSDVVITRSLVFADFILKKNYQPSVIYECHGLPDVNSKHIFNKLQSEKKFFKKIITITQALKNDLLEAYNFIKDEDIIVLPDGANLVPTSQLKEPENSPHTIGYVGHLYEGRGIDLIIALATELPQLEFKCIGGEEVDVKYWKQKIKGINNIVFTGHMAHKNLSSAYQSMDILLAPYQQKVRVTGNAGDTSKYMSPLKIFEYMAQKRPIIASKMPAIQEVLVDGENCLLAEVDNLMQWKECILKICENEQLRKKIAEKAYDDLNIFLNP